MPCIINAQARGSRMNWQTVPLEAGLYLVSTPIGNARDMTLRALDVLNSADVIAAEDTRTARKLMEIHGISPAGRPMWAYHDHSSDHDRRRVVAVVNAGQSVAYVSEAGTPMLADPGFRLAREVRATGGMVTAVPGASALLAALVVGDMPSDRLLFLGFLPASESQRRTTLAEISAVRATLAFYESPKRVVATLADLRAILGPSRRVSLCRELTKAFEEVVTAPLEELDPETLTLKGEFVILVEPPGEGDGASEAEIDAALVEALKSMRVKDAATAVAGALGLPRRDVYQRALEIGRD